MKIKDTLFLLLAMTFAVLLTGCLSFPRDRYIVTKEYDIGNFAPVKMAVPVKIVAIRNLVGAETRFVVKYKNCRVKFDDYSRWTLPIGSMFEKAYLSTFSYQDKNLNTQTLKFYCDIYDFSVSEDENFTIDVALTLQYNNRERQLRKVVTVKAKEFEAPFVAVAAKECMQKIMKYSASEINAFVNGVKK